MHIAIFIVLSEYGMLTRYKRFFLAAYEGERPLVRMRNESLLFVLSAIGFGAAVVAALIYGTPLRIALIGMTASCIVFLFLIRTGKADAVNAVSITAISAMLASLPFLQPYLEGSEIYSIVAYEATMLILAALVSARSFQMLLILGIGVAALTLDLLLRIAPGGGFSVNWINYVICVIVLTVAALIGRAIMNRSRMLIQAAETESERNAEQVRVLQSVIRSSKDALGTGATVKASSGRSEELIARLKALLDTARADMGRLSERTARIGASTAEVAASSRVVQDKVSDQTAVVAQSSSAIEEMTASVNTISGITSSRRQAIAALKDSTDSGSDQMSKAAAAVISVKESASSIAEVAKLIRAVAGRTNLLAMNAAIEAAHAGDAGLGFSVVANEIRGLSEETSRQAKNIDGSIKATLSAIETAAGMTGAARESFGSMSREADAVASSMLEIGRGLEEIATGTSEILQGVTESVNITDAVKDAARTVDERIGAAAADLDSLKALGAEVLSSLDRFLSLFDDMLAEARIMAAAGAASETGLSSLADALAGL